MFFRLILALIVFDTLNISPQCSQKSLPNVISRLYFHENVSENVKAYFIAALNDLNLKRTGSEIIRRINALLEEKDINFHVMDGPNISFSGLKNRDQVDLFINLEGLKKSFVSCIGFKKKFKNKRNNEVKEFFEIGKCKNPASITIGHELIHAIHYLENKSDFFMRQTSAKLPWTRKRIRSINCEGRQRRISIDECLWNNDEEQITVWGNPNEKSSFSELKLRLDHTLSPRYPYKNEAYFYESADVIMPLLSYYLGDNWMLRLNSVFRSQPWDFEPELARGSEYNNEDMSQYEEISDS